MTSAAFKSLAVSLMDEGDAALMDQLYLDPDPAHAGATPFQSSEGPSYVDRAPSTGCAFIDEWRDWERSFRLNAQKHRLIKTKRENTGVAEPPVFPTDAAAAAVKAVVGTDSPLEGEIIIDKARWNAIDVLVGNDYFDRNTIFAYYLKLVLLERRDSFKTEEGFAEYKSLYASILESAHPVGETK
jgi:hypothetical protein